MIKYLKGDATNPVGDGLKIIVHCCNDIGAWGAGFVMALSKKWSEPENCYLEWDAHCREKGEKLPLGAVQYVQVEEDIWVANLIGQRGVGKRKDGTPPIDYDAIKDGLFDVVEVAHSLGMSIHAPRFGAGLAGGDWNKIAEIIKYVQKESSYTAPVTIYDL